MPTMFAILALVASLCFLTGLLISERRQIRALRLQDREQHTMVSLLSHRLRTPLTSMKWYAELLLNQEFGNLQIAQMELLHKMNSAVQDSIQTLNTFLEAAQVEQGNLQYEPTSINVYEHLQRVLDATEERRTEKKLQLTITPSSSSITAFVNPLVFHTILEVLVSNAINYTPKGGTIAIHLSCKNRHVHIDVKDTGIGLSTTDREQLFTKFFRSERSKTMSTNGNGLGLYLVRQMLDQIGGSIRCASEEGKGSTFSITLPIAKDAACPTPTRNGARRRS